MLRRIVLALCLTSLAALPVLAQENGWQPVGGAALNAPGSGTAGAIRLALMPDGTPVAMYFDRGINYVQFWLGSAWENMGGALPDSVRETTQHDIAVSADGSAAVMWEVSPSTPRADNQPRQLIVGTASRDSTWQIMGEPLNVFNALPGRSLSGRVSEAHIAASPQGWIAAWREYDADNQPHILAKRWNGSAWESLGETVSRETPATEPGSQADAHFAAREGDIFTQGWLAMVVLPDDAPVIAWVDISGAAAVLRLSVWDGKSWQAVDTPDIDSLASVTDLVAAKDGTLYLAVDADTPAPVYRYRGGQWDAIGSPAAASESYHHMRLAIDAAEYPVAAWYDGALYAARWNVKTWEPVGEGAAGTGIDPVINSADIDLAAAPDGTLYTGWVHMDDGGLSVRVDQWHP